MNVLVVLTNENMGSDHVEGEKRHANNKGPWRPALANVLQSPSQMERDNGWAAEAACAAALGLICLCSLFTARGVPLLWKNRP